MILLAVCILSVIVLTAETLPFPNMNIRPSSVNQADQNFHRLHSTFYPLFGHPSQPIRQPDLQFSDMLDNGEGKFAGFIESRSRNPFSVFIDQNLRGIHKEKAEKVRQFGQQVRDTVQHYEERHRQRMQHVKEMLNDKFRFDKVKDRLKQALANKKASLGWRRNYIVEPYHTMNDDHKIVKKPSADFYLYSQPNVGTPILTTVPAIQPIAGQYPAVPEVTTSVNFQQESEVPATIAGYMFPVTSIATYTPDVIETTDIGNAIAEEKMTTPQLPSDASNCTDTTASTRIYTDPGTEGSILEENAVQETIFTAVDVSSRIKNGDFDTVRIDQYATTEIDSSSSPLPSAQTTWQIEKIEPLASHETLLLDLMSRIQVKPVTSSVIDVESTTTEISPTFLATAASIDDNFASQIIDTDTIIAERVLTIPYNFSTQKTLGTGETSLQPQALGTTTVADEIFGTANTDFASPATDPESTDETIFTFPLIYSTDTPTVTNSISTTIDATFHSSTIDEKTSMEIVSILPSTISTETTARLPPASEMGPILNPLFEFGYNRFPSFTDEVGIETTAVDATFPSTTQTDTITTSEEISTTTDSALYTHAVNDGRETTTEIVSTLPSKILPEITSWPGITPIVDVSSRFGYDNFPNFTDELEIIAEFDSTSSPPILTETTETMTERSTTVYPVTVNPTTETERITEIFRNFSSTILPETTTIFEETSTATDSHFYRSTTDEGITNDVLLTVFSTVPADSTVTPVSETASLSDALSSLGYNRFTDLPNAPETTTKVHSGLLSTIPTETTTILTERLMSVDSASDKPTLDVEITTEIVSALPSTILDEISTTMDSTPYIFTTDGHTTSEIVSTLPSTISLETTSWPLPASEITPLVDVLSRFGYNHLASFTDTVGRTTEVYSTFTSTAATETTTTANEKLTNVELALNNSIIDTEKTAEIVPMSPSVFSTETTPNLGEISTTELSDYPSIDEETTVRIIPTFTTKTPIVEQNYFTDSPNAPEITTRDDSTSSSPITTETIGTSQIDSMFPSTFLSQTTLTTTNLEEISTMNDKGTTMEIFSTIVTEKPIVVHDYFTESTIVPEITTRVDSTLSSIISAGTIETTEFEAMSPMTFPTEESTNLEEVSSTVPFDDLSNDEETTVDIISTFPTEAPIVEHNYFTDLPIAPEITIRDESESSSINPTETVTIVTERWTTSAYENSRITDTDEMMETDSIAPSVSTETLEEISTTEGSPSDSTTIYEETSRKVISTSSYVVSADTITNVKEISRAARPSFNSYTDAGRTTTEKIAMLSTPIPIDTTSPPIDEYDHTEEQNFEYLDGNQFISGVRIGRLLHENSDLVIPHVIYTAEEAPDEKSLLNLIPMIIDELRQGNVTPEEEYTLSQVFRDLWPLLKEESNRRPGELMDQKLAILIFEAGQRLSNNERLANDVANDNLSSKSKRQIGS